MRLLLNDEFAPITSTIGFLETTLDMAVQSFRDWQQRLRSQRADGRVLEQHRVSGSLAKILQTLLPLNSHEPLRNLFIPTTSAWVAYFDSGWRGTDPASMVSYLATQIPCRGLIVTAIPDTIRKVGASQRGRYGALSLSLYGPAKTDWLNVIRSIGVMNDGGEWIFSNQGTPLPFERTADYQSEVVRERFTFDQLQGYVQALGLSPFDESFYLPPENNQAVLIEMKGHKSAVVQEYTLAEARGRF